MKKDTLETKADKRARKRRKKRYGMKVSGRAVKVWANNEEFKYKKKHGN